MNNWSRIERTIFSSISVDGRRHELNIAEYFDQRGMSCRVESWTQQVWPHAQKYDSVASRCQVWSLVAHERWIMSFSKTFHPWPEVSNNSYKKPLSILRERIDCLSNAVLQHVYYKWWYFSFLINVLARTSNPLIMHCYDRPHASSSSQLANCFFLHRLPKAQDAINSWLITISTDMIQNSCKIHRTAFQHPKPLMITILILFLSKKLFHFHKL